MACCYIRRDIKNFIHSFTLGVLFHTDTCRMQRLLSPQRFSQAAILARSAVLALLRRPSLSWRLTHIWHRLHPCRPRTPSYFRLILPTISKRKRILGNDRACTNSRCKAVSLLSRDLSMRLISSQLKTTYTETRK